jgi:hypothetical protein
MADQHSSHGAGGTEQTDVKLRPVMVFGVGLIVLMVVVYLVVMAMFRLFSRQASREDVAAGTVQAQMRSTSEERLPPEPRIQADPAADLRVLRAGEDAALGSYGWVDRERGVVRVPIEVAMKLVLDQGLPVRQPEQAPTAPGAPTGKNGSSTHTRKAP